MKLGKKKRKKKVNLRVPLILNLEGRSRRIWRAFRSSSWNEVRVLQARNSARTKYRLSWTYVTFNLRFSRARTSFLLPSNFSFVSERLSYSGAYVTCICFPRKTESSNFLLANLLPKSSSRLHDPILCYARWKLHLVNEHVDTNYQEKIIKNLSFSTHKVRRWA